MIVRSECDPKNGRSVTLGHLVKGLDVLRRGKRIQDMRCDMMTGVEASGGMPDMRLVAYSAKMVSIGPLKLSLESQARQIECLERLKTS